SDSGNGIIRNCKQGRGMKQQSRGCVAQLQRDGNVLGAGCNNGAHKGCDYARADRGRAAPPVYALNPGKVIYAGYRRDYGNRIVVDEGNGRYTTYSHLKNFAVRKGQTVRRGTPLGIMGSTGQSTGIHLHIELI